MRKVQSFSLQKYIVCYNIYRLFIPHSKFLNTSFFSKTGSVFPVLFFIVLNVRLCIQLCGNISVHTCCSAHSFVHVTVHGPDIMTVQGYSIKMICIWVYMHICVTSKYMPLRERHFIWERELRSGQAFLCRFWQILWKTAKQPKTKTNKKASEEKPDAKMQIRQMYRVHFLNVYPKTMNVMQKCKMQNANSKLIVYEIQIAYNNRIVWQSANCMQCRNCIQCMQSADCRTIQRLYDNPACRLVYTNRPAAGDHSETGSLTGSLTLFVWSCDGSLSDGPAAGPAAMSARIRPLI